MKILRNVIKSDLILRTEKDYPVPGVEFIDITPAILQKDAFEEIIDLFVKEIKKKKVDYIIAPEARGFLLGSAISYELGIGCVPIRKKGKLPPTTVAKTFDYEKEYGKDTLELPKLVNDDYKDKRVYIVDDIYATGNTIKSIIKTIEGLGGNVIGAGCVVNIPALNNDKDVLSFIDINFWE